MVGHVTKPTAAVLDRLPPWVKLIRAPNPGPMTLDGTNSWLLRDPGSGAFVVVDPGPRHEEHLAAIAGHTPIAAILLTHTHPDHAEGLDRLRELCPTATLGEPGEALSALRLETVSTPGHTADSSCVVASVGDERVILTGDTILGQGTTVVAYPDGDLGAYLDSLRLLSAYHGIAVLPGHGPALADCALAADFAHTHRLARLAQIQAAVAAGARTVPDLVERIYADVDRRLWGAAELSVRAALSYVEKLAGRTPGGVIRSAAADDNGGVAEQRAATTGGAATGGAATGGAATAATGGAAETGGAAATGGESP